MLLKDDIQIAEHDIVLGLNIPNYRRKRTKINLGYLLAKINLHLSPTTHGDQTKERGLAQSVNMDAIMVSFTS